MLFFKELFWDVTSHSLLLFGKVFDVELWQILRLEVNSIVVHHILLGISVHHHSSNILVVVV